MNILKLTHITFIISLLSFSAVAQSVNPNIFNLDKIGSHYAFTANVNDKAEAKVMLESGVHGLIIDSAFIFRSPDQLDIVLVPDSTNGSFNLGARKCKITHKSAGKVKISPNLYFEGDIFVVRDLSKSVNMYIPIQKMFNYADNNNCLIKIDIKNRVMQSMSRASFNREKESYERLEMNNNSYLNMPCVETTFETGKNENNILKGNFNLDLGNGSFLFLRSQSEAEIGRAHV